MNGFEDLQGNVITAARSDRPVIIAVFSFSEVDRELPHVMVIEVRDADGVTRHLSWQGNTLAPFGGGQVRTYWIPSEPGSYEIRTFAIDKLHDPQALSSVHEFRQLTVR